MAGSTNKKFGRNDDKCKRYKVEQRREKAKIKHVLQSNGPIFAEKYAGDKGLIGFYRGLVNT